MPKDIIRILLAEDHELFRVSLEIALRHEKRLEIVGLASNGQECLDLFKKQKPDLILMDIGMPVINGLELVKLIKAESPETRIIMLTAHDDKESVLAAISSNADAYCTKDISLKQLTEIIPMVIDGAIYLDPLIAKHLYQIVAENHTESKNKENIKSRTAEKDISEYDTNINEALSARELEVLKLITEGKSNKEISQELFISSHTAKAHVSNIIQKLAAKDRTDASVKALKQGLL